VGRAGAAEGRLADSSPAEGAVSASSKSRPEASALRSVVVYDGALDIGEEYPVGATGVRAVGGELGGRWERVPVLADEAG